MQSNLLTSTEKQQFAACYATFFINGALALSIGALLPFIRDSYGLEYAFAGFLVSLHSIGNLLSSFLAGVLPIYLGKRKSIMLFSLCFALSFFIMSTTANRLVLAIAFVMTGLARGAVSNFNNKQINEIATGKAWALNALHASFAVGAFIAPFVVLLCTDSSAENWRIMCYIMVIMGIIELLIYGFMPIPQNSVKQTQQSTAGYGFLKQKQWWLCTGTLFFYLCAEQGVIGWMVTYFKDSGYMSAGYAQVMASILWILILAGRLSAAALSQKMDKGRLLRIMGIGFIIFFAIVMMARSLPLITIGIAGFGFSMAGIYPTTVALSGDTIKAYPLAWSVMLTSAGLGAIIMPTIIGAVAGVAGIYAGMLTIVFAVVLTVIFIYANTVKKSA